MHIRAMSVEHQRTDYPSMSLHNQSDGYVYESVLVLPETLLISLQLRFVYQAQQSPSPAQTRPQLPPKVPQQPPLPPKVSHKGPELPPKIKIKEEAIRAGGPTTDGKAFIMESNHICKLTMANDNSFHRKRRTSS